MANNPNQENMLAVITEMTKRAPRNLGRTALMKCLFFLKTLRGVPLSYNFRLYTHGPFDADVLDDLQYAQALGAIESTVVAYPGGYGYLLKAGPQAEKIEKQAGDFLHQHGDSIDWVLSEFGTRSAVDLEMASTLIFVDRSLAEKKSRVSLSALAKMVHDIKPHLTTEVIEREARSLQERSLLRAIN
jgi:uncharacterized protein